MSTPGTQSDPFWLCHECGAQMRPIRRSGVPHCASCDGEFIEILDAAINPDPFQHLPPPPPTRPQSTPPRLQPSRSGATSPRAPSPGGEPGFMQSIFGSMFGMGSQEREASGSQPGASDRDGTGNRNTMTSGSSGGRTFTLNFPGGGHGQVTFGSFNAQMGPFGSTEGNGGLESFFPGFPPVDRGSGGQRTGGNAGDPLAAPDLMRALMQMMAEDGAIGVQMGGGGPSGRMGFGDYVMSERGFDDVLERLMTATGPQGPIPAADIVIDGLPRFRFTEKSLAESAYKDCPVCKDDFSPGDEVMLIPCAHVFHPDCLQPWLKVNGSCPVCRFSLVPEGGIPSRADNEQAAPNQPDGQTTINSVLQRLFGQSGTASNVTSPTTEAQTQMPASRPSTSSASQPPTSSAWLPVHQDSPGTLTEQSGPPTSGQPVTAQPSIHTDIPDDYRERHRRREAEQEERQQHQQYPHSEDVD